MGQSTKLIASCVGSTNVTKYVGFDEKLKEKSFDLMMIDGPYGYRSPDYSRVDILSILPDCLNDEFVILMDDCDRKGEQRTCQLIGYTLQGRVFLTLPIHIREKRMSLLLYLKI